MVICYLIQLKVQLINNQLIKLKDLPFKTIDKWFPNWVARCLWSSIAFISFTVSEVTWHASTSPLISSATFETFARIL